MRDYELVVITKPEAVDRENDITEKVINQFITDRGGVVSELERWGLRKLAYPIGRSTEGDYTVARFKLEPSAVRELDTNLRISEDVIRHLVIRVGS
ncbi:30S ribosomal protein S6 [Chloroflexota bacterium]